MKNGKAAERSIAVDHYAEVIEDYIEYNRHAVEDDYGRDPLITSEYGRLSETPIRRTVYRWTRRCMVGDCPHDEGPDTCPYMTDGTGRASVRRRGRRTGCAAVRSRSTRETGRRRRSSRTG